MIDEAGAITAMAFFPCRFINTSRNPSQQLVALLTHTAIAAGVE